MHARRTLTNRQFLLGLGAAGICACGPAPLPEKEVPLSAVKTSISINITSGQAGGYQHDDSARQLTFGSIQDAPNDHCNRLAAELRGDLDGTALTIYPGGSSTVDGSFGGSGPVPTYQPAGTGCGDPVIDLPAPADGNARSTVHLQDSSAKWTVAVDALGARRTVTLHAAGSTIRAGDQVAIEFSPPTDELGDSANVSFAGHDSKVAIAGTGTARTFTMPELRDADGALVEFTPVDGDHATLGAASFIFVLHPHVATCEGPTHCEISEVWVPARLEPKAVH